VMIERMPEPPASSVVPTKLHISSSAAARRPLRAPTNRRAAGTDKQ